jgi:hypothetical protein
MTEPTIGPEPKKRDRILIVVLLVAAGLWLLYMWATEDNLRAQVRQLTAQNVELAAKCGGAKGGGAVGDPTGEKQRQAGQPAGQLPEIRIAPEIDRYYSFSDLNFSDLNLEDRTTAAGTSAGPAVPVGPLAPPPPPPPPPPPLAKLDFIITVKSRPILDNFKVIIFDSKGVQIDTAFVLLAANDLKPGAKISQHIMWRNERKAKRLEFARY